jgi:hypothetical protein
MARKPILPKFFRFGVFKPGPDSWGIKTDRTWEPVEQRAGFMSGSRVGGKKKLARMEAEQSVAKAEGMAWSRTRAVGHRFRGPSPSQAARTEGNLRRYEYGMPMRRTAYEMVRGRPAAAMSIVEPPPPRPNRLRQQSPDRGAARAERRNRLRR